MKRYIPTYYIKNIYCVNIDFYKKLNIKYILCDLDNTLDSYKMKTPSQKAFDLVKELKENGIELIINSNNKQKRVKKYADKLETRYNYRAFKPFKSKTLKFLKKNQINKEDVVIIGDQLSTDIKLGNKINIKTIFVEKLVEEESLITKINRIRDNHKKQILLKNKLLQLWEE